MRRFHRLFFILSVVVLFPFLLWGTLKLLQRQTVANANAQKGKTAVDICKFKGKIYSEGSGIKDDEGHLLACHDGKWQAEIEPPH